MALAIDLLPVVGILTVAAITPGPNNYLVFHAAVNGGVRSAGQSIAGVICGSFALLGIVTVGFNYLINNSSHLMAMITIAGSTYLVVLGLRLYRTSFSDDRPDVIGSPLPNTFVSIVVFQLLNPKGWILMSVVYSTALPLMPWAGLFLLLTIVFAACLAAWACAGIFLSAYIQQPSSMSSFNRIMGVTLILLALTLLLQGLAQLPWVVEFFGGLM
jgi:threonine/homoserine/homoserine lactone efflux protein